MSRLTFAIVLVFLLFFLGCEKKENNIKEGKEEIKKVVSKKVDFSKLTVKEKKQRFLELLKPATIKVYNRLNKQYHQVKDSIEKNIDNIKIAKLKETYRVETDEELLMALKPHPISITLAQAAMESSWATSRFFQKANNVFGVWSFSEDDERIAAGEKRGDKTIWLKKYKSIEESVADYYKVLARSHAFKEFRENRLKTDDPHILVKFLDKYSEKGSEYGKELSSMIKYNKFRKFDIDLIDNF